MTVLLSAVMLLASCSTADPGYRGWEVYGGDKGSTHYSALDQINKKNVHRLEIAWVHRTGDAEAGRNSQIQTNPIVIGGVLYGVSAGLKAFALKAATGECIWTFEPVTDSLQGQRINRGVAYWSDEGDERLFYSAGPHVYALNPATGKLIPSFGTAGRVDLRRGLGRDVSDQWVVARTPGVVYKNLLIQGTVVSEARHAPPGHIRAYDVRTGEQRWIFHTIPHPGEYGYETWPEDAWRTAGGANSWAGMAVDEERGLVFAPTGAPSVQYYGGDILGQNLFASTLLALDANTGTRRWHFQVVHHDVYDRDLPAPPNLVTLIHGGRRVDAVAQVTKTGHVFLFDRETGKPLFPIEERPVPASPLEGESAWPTQPFPVKPEPFVRQSFTEEEVTDLSPGAAAGVLDRFKRLRAGGPFNPPSVEGSIFFPFLNGGAEWGGAAVDPHLGILYVNGNELPQIITMHDPERLVQAHGPATGPALYATYCSGCHGADREGDAGRQPSLLNLKDRMDEEDVLRIIEQGQGFMPSFEDVLSAPEKEALVGHLLDLVGQSVSARTEGAETRRASGAHHYQVRANERFVDKNGYPAVKPPWGTLSAINLNTGETLWRVPLGEYPELTAQGVPPTGTENYGGPVVTAGGLIFIGATKDEKFRAFDKDTGDLLWEIKLPFGGYATPATYEVNGRQYVVIAAGGGKMGTRSGDAYVAFALPQ